MTGAAPELSVIIPVYNGESTLETCLKAVFGSRGVDMEVIVVDDASTDSSRAIAESFPLRLIALPIRVGGGLARNPGAKAARAPILVFTDADVEMAPDTLHLLLKAFDAQPALAALFGSYGTSCPHEDFFSQYKNLHHHFIHRTSKGKVSTFWTGCGAVRKAAFETCGGFRDVSHIYDIDLGYRLTKGGYAIELFSGIEVTHHKRYTFLSLLRSDIRERAVPWTGLMLEHRFFQNNLNTHASQVGSVLLVFAGLAWLVLAQGAVAKIAGPIVSLGVITVINGPWMRFCAREKGWYFGLRAMAMEWLYFFYSGLGALMGALAWAAKSRPVPLFKRQKRSNRARR
jgi:glycosyltransferase involved in cell wall biosynthesis